MQVYQHPCDPLGMEKTKKYWLLKAYCALSIVLDTQGISLVLRKELYVAIIIIY